MTKPESGPFLTRVGNRPQYYIYDPRIKKRISTGETSRGAASAVLMEYVEKTRRQYHPTQTSLFSAVLNTYAENRRQMNPTTYEKKWKYVVKGLMRYAGHKAVSELNTEWSRSYVSMRTAEGVKAATIRQELTTVLAALKLSELNKPKFNLPKAPEARDVWLRREEVERLIDACPKKYQKLFIRLGVETGGRHEALLSLTWNRVDIEAKRIDLRYVREEAPAAALSSEPLPRGENDWMKRAAIVPISKETAELLAAVKEHAVTEYVIEYRGRPLRSIRKAFETAVKKAGLKDWVTPHTLRHSAATWMAISGVDLFQIASFLGHSDIEMVRRVYGHHHPDYMQDAKNAVSMEARS